ncbi:MAG TPA: hypothetical protein VNK50_03010 [Calidithermus sp.]|nr:hypothetical protein [Calidithermus sp.]
MVEESPAPADDSAERRRLRFRRRDDYAVELFQEARAHLDDLPRVDRILLVLGRFYNPYLNAPIVDLATRRRVIEALEAGRHDEARALLDERLRLYSRPPGVEE